MAESQSPVSNKRYNINAYAPRSGLILGADGRVYDLVTLLKGAGGSGSTGGSGQDGLTPHIGENGNWYLGETDTGTPAQGPPGQNGLTPHIGENGNWYLGETDTGVKAQGDAGGLKLGDGLALSEDGALTVQTTSDAEQDNTLPMTSAGVYTQLGNISILLETI